jgi:hypothetical protein
VLKLKVQSGFWLVLLEKSDSGFPVVNPAYEAAIGDRTDKGDVKGFVFVFIIILDLFLSPEGDN